MGREIPILMSGPLVRATLEGAKPEYARSYPAKTQTRRPIKPQPGPDIVDFEYDPDADLWLGNTQEDNDLGYCSSWSARIGGPGDRLWVRETWRIDNNLSRDRYPQVVYRADKGFMVARNAPVGVQLGTPNPKGDIWTPSIHMPRWACRLVLPLVKVRIERVQDITEEDAKAEGVEPVLMRGIGSYPEWMRPTMREVGGHQKAFELLWKQIYGDASWDANPWVWVAEWKDIEART